MLAVYAFAAEAVLRCVVLFLESLELAGEIERA